jgi:flagellar biosynthesis protein FlhB
MSDRSEPASPKRIREARERGQVGTSREAVSVAALLAGLGALWATRQSVLDAFRVLLATAVRAASTPGTPAVTGSLAQAGSLALGAIVPPLVAAAAAATLVGALLTGFLIAPAAALPKLERLDPSQALARYTKPRTYVEPLLQLLKGAALLWFGWSAARALLPTILASPRLSSASAATVLGELLRTIATRIAAAAALLAGLDALYRRWQQAQDLRMSKDEVKRENKESEGDPHTRQAREELRREILADAAVHNVRKASFVVTNPTHYAVALAWDEETMDAPSMVAKGEGALARRIIEEAHRAGIPVLRNAPLARSLHELEVGDEIPEALYDAVAAVVGYLAEGRDPAAFEE